MSSQGRDLVVGAKKGMLGAQTPCVLSFFLIPALEQGRGCLQIGAHRARSLIGSGGEEA